MLTLYVGSKRLSSWSLRPYLALAHAGAPFTCKTIVLDVASTRAEIAKVNPTGRVPVLHVGDDLVIWDSLAICEYAHERFGNLWPAEPKQRARARSISAEMHSSFAALRQNMPMDLCSNKAGQGHTPEALADAARIKQIWSEALARSGGPFLFGAFSIADAMFAPPATRFRTYGVDVEPDHRAYMDAMFAHPAMVAWQRDADAEPPIAQG